MTDAAVDFAARLDSLLERHQVPAGQRPASTARGVHHLALICSDVEQTIGFYQGLLGFPLVEAMENRDYAGSTHLFFDIGNGNLLAFFDFPGLGLGPSVEAIGGVQHVAISVTSENWVLLQGRLEEAGIEYFGADRGADDSMYFRDPDGIQIELIREELGTMCGRLLGE